MPGRFDIIYLFNVFTALDHGRALEQFALLIRQGGRLIVFDYLQKARDRKDFPFREWRPIDLSTDRSLFSGSGWRIVQVADVSDLYEIWYRTLVSRIESRSRAIIDMAGEEWFRFVRSFYGAVLDALEKKTLGGAIVYADRP